MDLKAQSRRLESERLFHNKRYSHEEDPRHYLGKYYGAISHAMRLQENIVRTEGREKCILEYGCADGSFSIRELNAPSFCAEFHGVDISDSAVEKAKTTAKKRGYLNAHFHCMNAERMSFESEKFDLVFGKGIIHHLDLNSAFSEISRVLKPGGKAVFLEPMGHNPVINWYRSRTPSLRTPDEHPILMKDLELAREFFPEAYARYFGLATLVYVPFRDLAFAGPLLAALRVVDQALFSLPFMNRGAWFVLLSMTKKPARLSSATGSAAS